MKLQLPLLASALLLGSTPALAATYQIAGELSSIGVTSGEALGGLDLSPELNVSGLENAHHGYGLASTLEVDLLKLTVTGTLRFAPFTLEVSPVAGGALDGQFGTTWVSYGGDNYQISGGTTSYDHATRTLTLTNAHLLGGQPPVVTGDEIASLVMSGFRNTDLLFSMELNFSEEFNQLTGRATGIDVVVDPDLVSLVSHATLKYTIHETPAPAAAWLFGSALVGLGGLARRRTA